MTKTKLSPHHMPKPEDWDPRSPEVIEAEKGLEEHGATRIVSLWLDTPYVMGVTATGNVIIVSKAEDL